MKKTATLLGLIAATLLLGACWHGGPHQRHSGHGMMGGPPTGGAAIYSCNCGPECTCNAVSTQPGTCGCGKAMAGGHVIWTEGDTALVCTCGPDCTCAFDPKDPTKCPCGKPIKRVNLKGTGLYFCNCGGSCGCNTVSAQPGPCKCGMPLHQAP